MRPLKILINRNPQFGKCPDCKGLGTLHRSRARNFFESSVKRFTFFKIYRCKSCGWRGFKSNLAITWQSLKTIVIYLAVAGLAAFIVRFVLQKFL